MILLSIITVNTYSSDATAISMQPAGVVDETLGPGQSFTVDIVISDVTNLGGYEFTLSYSTSVLTTSAADVTIVTDWFSPDGIKVWTKKVDDTLGYMRLVVSLPLGTMVGIDGSGTVVTIKFTVDDYGTTVLDLHDTMLGDPWAVPIIHGASDGFFANVPLPQLWIKDKGAQGGGMWPEWHVADPGTPQTLYARIVNTGDAGCYIKVKVNVYSPNVGSLSPVSTGQAWIPPKEAHNVTVTLTADFTDTHTTGVYYVSGTIEFSLDEVVWVQYSALEDIIGGRGTTRDVPGNDATKFKTH